MNAALVSDRRASLYVMKISHYCERARWGLDFAGVPYDEKAWAPGPHMLLARRMKAKGSSVPILKTDDQVVQGSSAILSWAGLGQGDAAIEDRFDTVIAPLLRQYVYSGTLNDAGSGVREILMRDVPPAQAALARFGWPMIRREMAKMMDIRSELLPELERRIDRELDWADTLVSADGPLVRESFGRTQITAASLLSPLAQPDALPIYKEIRLPSAIGQAYERWRNRPALEWARSTYAQHRRRHR